jgi:4'-phosphopantetheinyl transferase EntD
VLFADAASPGVCEGVEIFGGSPEETASALVGMGILHPAEAGLAYAMPPLRALTFMCGRAAMRKAIGSLGMACPDPIGSTPRGAPMLPGGITGSISHKQSGGRTVAVAMAEVDDGRTAGVDIEIADTPRGSVAAVVLTREELEDVRTVAGEQRWFEVLLRFSLKEAIYKAVDPLVSRYVDYREVSVFPQDSGKAGVVWHPVEPGPKLEIESSWSSRGGFILTTARARKS